MIPRNREHFLKKIGLTMILLKGVRLEAVSLLVMAAALFAMLPIEPAKADASPVIKRVAASLHHSVAVMDDGTLWTWGENSDGQLGIGNNSPKYSPERVVALSDVQSVAAGGFHTFAVKNDGTIWSWGGNFAGQLGIGNKVSQKSPVPITDLTDVKAVATGYQFAVVLKNDGNVWAMGIGSSGQLGTGDNNGQITPVQVGISDVKDIAAKFMHTAAVKEDGTVWTWGYNDNGQLGNGNTTTQNAPVQVMYSGEAFNNVKAVATGKYHTLALKEDGTVWSWGFNGQGQLGTGNTYNYQSPVLVSSLTDVKAIASGDFYSIALKNDGTVWAWGQNDKGQLGINLSWGTRNFPVQVVDANSSPLTNIISVAAGENHALALTSDGTVWSWGANDKGQLGDGTSGTYSGKRYATKATFPVPAPTFSPSPTVQPGSQAGSTSLTGVTAGAGNRLAVQVSSGVIATPNVGDVAPTGTYVAGTDITDVDAVTNKYVGLYEVDSAGKVVKFSLVTLTSGDINSIRISVPSNRVAASLYHSVAIMNDGTLWTWGDNSDGQLGIGNNTRKSTPERVVALSDVQSVAAGGYHTFAVKNDGTIWSWGGNYAGQLGIGNTVSQKSPVQITALTDVKAVTTGYQFAVALKNDGAVWAMGIGSSGQLGTGDTVNQSTPVQVGITNVKNIAARFMHTAAVKEDGSVWTWGYNNQGQLGNGNTTTQNTPVQVVLNGGGAFGNVKAVAAGKYHTLALKEDGTVWAWGFNGQGQLGNGGTTSSNYPVKVTSLSDVKAIAAGELFSIALKNDGTVWTWGQNDKGQLGFNLSWGTRNFPVQVVDVNSSALNDIVSIAAGENHGLALTSDGTVWSWGANDEGQLGDGSYGQYAGKRYATKVTFPVPAPSTDNLDAAITAANALLNNHPEGTGIGQVSATARIALGNAIVAAQEASEHASSMTQDEVDEAEVALEAAMIAFEAAVVKVGNPGALNTVLNEASGLLTDHPVGAGVGQASATARAELEDAISTAQAIFNDAANRTQEQLDTAKSVLEAAVSAFESAVVKAGNPSALNTTLGEASALLTNHAEGAGVGQASATARAALEDAISSAQAIFNDAANRKQGELDAAKLALEAAVTSFEAAVVKAGNPAALNTVLSEASGLLTSHTQGTGVGQASATARTELEDAISAAQAIFNDASNRTQGELDAAKTALEAAVSTFEAAVVKAGNPAALNTTLGEASALLTNHAEGAGVGQASATARTELEDAISAAQAIFNDAANRTQTQLDAAKTALEAAVTAFEEAVVKAGNPAELNTVLSEASVLLTNHAEGAGVGQASATARTTLEDAISAAQAIFNDASNRTQGELDTAKSALEAAVSIFEAAVVKAGNPVALNTVLSEASGLLTNHAEGTGVGQASATARAELEDAISTAQAIFNDAANRTQAQLDAAKSALEAAVTSFESAVVKAGNPAALNTTLGEASALLTNHAEGAGVGQASATSRTALEDAISTAQAIFNDASNRTQGELDAAKTALEAAITAFEAAVVKAGNPAALNTTLGEVSTLLTNHTEGTSVGQASATARTALEDAISAAQAIFNDASNRTQGELDAAKTALEAAVTTFEAAVVKAGNPTALNTTLGEASTLLTNHTEGTSVGQASATARTALEDAISAAQAIFNDAANRTQGELDAAKTALEAAVSTFEAAVVKAGSPAALNTVLSEASGLLTNHTQGTGVGQASATARTELEDAISAAQAIFNDAANRTQGELDTAKSALEAAMTTFEAAVVIAGNPGGLNTELGEAAVLLTNHAEGTSVGQASATARTALEDAISTAQAIFNDASNRTQGELDAAKTALEAAVTTFEAAVVKAGNPAALNTTLGEASTLLTNHAAGAGVGQASATARAELEDAISAAQAIFNDASNRTQAQLDTAKSTLEAAVTAFEAAVVKAGNPAALNTTLGEASTLLTNHAEGTSVGQASATARTELGDAISAAQAIFNDASNRTQGELDAAKTALEAAVTAFEAAVVKAGNSAALNTTLGEASTLLTNHTEGTGVGQASATARTELEDAISTAQAIFNDAANRTQAQLDAAKSALEAAMTTFEAALVKAGNPAELHTTIAEATELLTKHTEGSGVGQASAAARLALQNAINDAKAIDDHAVNQTQTQLDTAKDVLATAISVFSNAIVKPVYSGGNSAPSSASEIRINGKTENAGTVTTTTRNDQKVATITLDEKKLADRIAAEGANALISIPAKQQTDVVIGELTGQMVKDLASKEARLEIITDRASYTLPAMEINMDAVSAQFGSSVALKDIKVQIEIAEASTDTVKFVQNAANNKALTLVVPPLNFKITATFGEKTINIAQFNAYVERTIALPEGIDASKITTGVIVDPDGTIRHVPTKVVLIDGKYYATINSLTNSTYTVVWNPVAFSDMVSHWAQSAVNDMGSRLIVEGDGKGNFQPDREVTRAEFTAIIVRALGLKLEDGITPFSDVRQQDWYSDAVHAAYSYQLISGYNDGTFRPNEHITREQAMAIISRAMQLTGLREKLPQQPVELTLGNYTDMTQASAWSREAIAHNVLAGIVTGRNAKQIAPQANITRAEVAEIVRRLLSKSDLI